jgi:YD repeat-containing protein
VIIRKSKGGSCQALIHNSPERPATINDGTGTYWTSKNTYTTFDALSTKTDARGVVATYSYDSLHRVTQVSYNTVSGITTAPTVTYTYDTDSTYNESGDGVTRQIKLERQTAARPKKHARELSGILSGSYG